MTTASTDQVAARLRDVVRAARRVGEAENWMPRPTSAPFDDLRHRYADTEQRLLAEAAMHSQMLMQAQLEHVEGVAHLLRTGAAASPRVLARAAVEAGIRICHALDPDASRTERAHRRLSEWTSATGEGQARLDAAQESGLVDAPDEVARQEANVADLERCLAVYDLRLKKQKFSWHLVDKGGARVKRISTTRAVDQYLQGDHHGLPSFLVRGDSAYAHGVELGLLSHTRDEPVLIPPPKQGYPSYAREFIHLPRLTREPLDLALVTYLLVPTALLSSFEVIVDSFEWDRSSRFFEVYAQQRDKLLELWRSGGQPTAGRD